MLNIRQATIADAQFLVQLARKSFYGAFVRFPQSSPDVLSVYLNKTYTVESLIAELADDY